MRRLFRSANATAPGEAAEASPASRGFPRDILERIERVLEFHRSTGLTPQSLRANPTTLNAATKPSVYRCFDDLPIVALPTDFVPASAPAISLLRDGIGADPNPSHVPQNLQTLASWLHLANGLAHKQDANPALQRLRTCPSSGGLFPCELYVGAFAIEGLEPGLYHYNVRDFTLCKMREGPATLATLKRGRPELNFLKSAPAAILVSTVFWRSAWRYRQRGYRMALLDAGHLVQNLVTAGNGLGITLNSRLQAHDKNMRDAIGVPSSAEFGVAESVQAMVVWADAATAPMAESNGNGQRVALPRIARQPLSAQHVPYGSIVATHYDCVSPGVTVREIRPPLTELSPVAAERLQPAPDYSHPLDAGPAIGAAMLSRRSVRSFADRSISRDHFMAINRLAFRGGSVYPMMPDGPHVATLRPFWISNLVAGLNGGMWYYDPAGDRLTCLGRGSFYTRGAFLCTEQPMCAKAAAVCFLFADLRTLTAGAGPDAYRMAHLEAGVAGQRVYLAASALGLGACGIGAFYDDEARKFFGLADTNWDPLYALAVGHNA